MSLDLRINFLWAIANNQSKQKVHEKFVNYTRDYDNLNREPKIHEKIRHREMFEKYVKYMSKEEIEQ